MDIADNFYSWRRFLATTSKTLTKKPLIGDLLCHLADIIDRPSVLAVATFDSLE